MYHSVKKRWKPCCSPCWTFIVTKISWTKYIFVQPTVFSRTISTSHRRKTEFRRKLESWIKQQQGFPRLFQDFHRMQRSANFWLLIPQVYEVRFKIKLATENITQNTNPQVWHHYIQRFKQPSKASCNICASRSRMAAIAVARIS